MKKLAAVTCDFPPKLEPVPRGTIVDAREKLFLSAETADHVILLPHGEKIPVHKCLMRGWPFFQSVLIHGKDQIHDTEMPASTFKKLVAYFYLGEHMFRKQTESSEFLLDFSDVAWILLQSDYYLLNEEKPLLQRCSQAKVTKENWPQALKIGVQKDSEKLRAKAFRVAKQSGVTIEEVFKLYESLMIFSWNEMRKLP
jgi:hypothetical protein